MYLVYYDAVDKFRFMGRVSELSLDLQRLIEMIQRFLWLT